ELNSIHSCPFVAKKSLRGERDFRTAVCDPRRFPGTTGRASGRSCGGRRICTRSGAASAIPPGEVVSARTGAGWNRREPSAVRATKRVVRRVGFSRPVILERSAIQITGPLKRTLREPLREIPDRLDDLRLIGFAQVIVEREAQETIAEPLGDRTLTDLSTELL